MSLTDLWFSPGTLVSSTNKTDRLDTTEILLKVALNTIAITYKLIIFNKSKCFFQCDEKKTDPLSTFFANLEYTQHIKSNVVIVLVDNDLIATKTTSDDEIVDSLIGSKNTVDENSDIDVEDAVFNNLT